MRDDGSLRNDKDATGPLVGRLTQGDASAIDELLGRHLSSVRVFVRLEMGAQLRQRESSSDIVQAVCLDLLRNLRDFEYRGETQFRHWLCLAARNKVRERNRYFTAERRDGDREVSDGDQALGAVYAMTLTPSRMAMANETVQLFEAAFDRLPEDYREVILLCRVVGCSQQDVAERMGRSVDSVRNLLHRALGRLAESADEVLGNESA